MIETLVYNQCSFDTKQIESGQPICARFFDDDLYLDGSSRVTDLEEKSIIRWLMFHPEARGLLLAALHKAQHSSYALEVGNPFFAKGKGDLDLLFYSQLNPSEAIVMECKCVKVVSVNGEQDKMNKLQGVGEGVCQVKRLYDRYAFHETYFTIITLVEASGKENEVSNILFRGVRTHSTPCSGDTTRTTFRQIVEFPGREELTSSRYEGVGIIHIEVVRPSRLSISNRASIAACVFRRARQREQAVVVTQHIREIMQPDAGLRN